MRIVSRSVVCSLIFALAALVAGAADAQQCTPCPVEPELVEPFEIPASGSGLSTTLRVKNENLQVPVWTQQNNVWQCCMQSMTLRSYHYPTPNGEKYGLTGPTLRVRKPSTPGAFGDSINVNLVNALPPVTGSDHACDTCPGPCTGSNQPKCCSAQDVYPNCFHGDNTTNLHFHGTHVSPQEPQDYVFLELKPAGSSYEPPHECSGTVATGSFQYAVSPLPYTQPEGTHWYHPHKHGSTALQVANGMAGALIIEGPFDDWLRNFYQKQGFQLREKVLVVQQFSQVVNFDNPFAAGVGPTPLINGQANPRIKMKPGEIQRWRFVGATMQGSAQIQIDFDGELATPVVAKQIAMDGIQFAPGNYHKQPLLGAGQEFNLSPGNRADFLVQAPTVPGKFKVTFELFGIGEKSKQRPNIVATLQAIAAGDAEPHLFIIEVEPCPTCSPMSFPADLPPLPGYLSNIVPNAPPRSLYFELKESGQPVGPGTMPSQFYINLEGDKQANVNRQFCPCCAAITARLDTSEQWTIYNTTPDQNPFHVFHMHVNPFQVVKNGSVTYNPPIWQDAITLPASESVVINQRYEEFTGAFVLHCHFLAHEDRGMMLAVQIVCPESTTNDGKLWFGKPKANGQPECVAGNLIPAKPQCPVPVTPECKP